MKTIYFAAASAEERLAMDDLLGGRSNQQMVRDEVAFRPPVDPWNAVLMAAQKMHERNSSTPDTKAMPSVPAA